MYCICILINPPPSLFIILYSSYCINNIICITLLSLHSIHEIEIHFKNGKIWGFFPRAYFGVFLSLHFLLYAVNENYDNKLGLSWFKFNTRLVSKACWCLVKLFFCDNVLILRLNSCDVFFQYSWKVIFCYGRLPLSSSSCDVLFLFSIFNKKRKKDVIISKPWSQTFCMHT